MNQSRYIENILSKFGMADCKPHSTTCEMDIMKTSDEANLTMKLLAVVYI